MIDQHILKYHWEEPPTEMEFQMPFSELVGELENLIFKKDKNKEDYIKIYIKTPFLVSTALDLHVERKIDPTIYPLTVELIRSVFSEKTERVRDDLKILKSEIPSDYQIESKKDISSWSGSDPNKLHLLADNIVLEGGYHPDVIVGTAHGSIRAAADLSLILNTGLYFLRVSHFKRNDAAPVVTPADADYLTKLCTGKQVLAFDEQACSGDSLAELAVTLRGMGFEPVRTAAASAYRHLGLIDHHSRVNNILGKKEHKYDRQPDFVGYFFD